MAKGIYRIIVKGQLDANRSEWFEGWTITKGEDGSTVLTGPVVDQAALHGMLVKILNLALPIVSVNCLESNKGEDGIL